MLIRNIKLGRLSSRLRLDVLSLREFFPWWPVQSTIDPGSVLRKVYKTRAHIFIPSIGLRLTPQDLSLPASLVILRMRSFAAFTAFIAFGFLTLISALPSGASNQDINVCYLHFLNYTILTMSKIVAEHSLRGGGNSWLYQQRECPNRSLNQELE